MITFQQLSDLLSYNLMKKAFILESLTLNTDISKPYLSQLKLSTRDSGQCSIDDILYVIKDSLNKHFEIIDITPTQYNTSYTSGDTLERSTYFVIGIGYLTIEPEILTKLQIEQLEYIKTSLNYQNIILSYDIDRSKKVVEIFAHAMNSNDTGLNKEDVELIRGQLCIKMALIFGLNYCFCTPPELPLIFNGAYKFSDIIANRPPIKTFVNNKIKTKDVQDVVKQFSFRVLK